MDRGEGGSEGPVATLQASAVAGVVAGACAALQVGVGVRRAAGGCGRAARCRRVWACGALQVGVGVGVRRAAGGCGRAARYRWVWAWARVRAQRACAALQVGVGVGVRRAAGGCGVGIGGRSLGHGGV